MNNNSKIFRFNHRKSLFLIAIFAISAVFFSYLSIIGTTQSQEFQNICLESLQDECDPNKTVQTIQGTPLKGYSYSVPGQQLNKFTNVISYEDNFPRPIDNIAIIWLNAALYFIITIVIFLGIRRLNTIKKRIADS